MRGEIDFYTSIRRRIEKFRGVDYSLILETARKTEPRRGASELAGFLCENGFGVFILTGGLEPVSKRVVERINAHGHLSNQLLRRDGKVQGVKSPIIGRSEKGYYAEALALLHGVPLSRCVAVGDGANDEEVLKRVGLGVAFNAKPSLRKVADVSVKSENLADIVPHMESFIKDNFLKLPKQTTHSKRSLKCLT